jgi:hypothetical protein
VTFCHYLQWLSDYIDGRRPGRGPRPPIQLILDCYAVHRSKDVREFAANLGIRLWFIPAGHTDTLQPLDRAVFGAIKAMFRRLFELLRRGTPGGKVTKSNAMDILSNIWRDLSIDAIHAGWAIYEDDFGPEEDDDDYTE